MFADHSWPRPTNPESFESWCRLIFDAHLGATLTKYKGRGFAQHGLDLVGHSRAKELCGIQCKVRNLDETLTEEEIADDVKKAKAAPFKLQRLIFATTAQRRSLQDFCIALTTKHHQVGLFTVEIYAWPDLCDLINQHDNVRRQIFPGTDSSATDAKLDHIISQLGRIDVTNQTIVGDKDVDEIQDQIRRGDLVAAGVLIERIQQGRWSALSEKLKQRVLLAHAHVVYGLGDMQRAADAFSAIPDSDNDIGATSRALAMLLRGNHKQAFDAASEIVARRPSNARAQAIRIRAAPDEIATQDLTKGLAQEIDEDAEVLMARSWRAGHCGDLIQAIALARRAASAREEWTEVKIELACALIEFARNGRQIASQIQLSPAGEGAAIEAEQLLSSLLAPGVQGQPSPQPNATALENRGVARMLLRRVEDAVADFERAWHLRPTDTDTTLAYATGLVLNQRVDQAIQILEKACVYAQTPRPHLMLGMLLLQRSNSNDVESALHVMEAGLDISGSASVQSDGLLIQATSLRCQRKEIDQAERLIERATHAVSRSASQLAIGLVLLHRGEPLAARRIADSIESCISQSGDEHLRRQLAIFFDELGDPAKAIELWKPLLRLDHVNQNTLDFLRACEKASDTEELLSTCKALRSNGVFHPEIVRTEVSTLLRFREEGDAASILQQYLKHHPNDPPAVVQLAMIAVRTERRDFFGISFEQLPAVTASSADMGRVVTLILCRMGRREEAAAFAYRLLRRYRDDRDAHIALIAAVLMPQLESLSLQSPVVVCPGAAVTIRGASGREKVFVIEDETDPPPSLSHDELAPTHEIAKALLGAIVGDRRTLPTSFGLHDRGVTIIGINSKIVWRANECASTWQDRFPDVPFIAAYDADDYSSGESGVIAMMRITLEKQNEHVERGVAAFRSGRLPVASVAQALGRTIIATHHYLSSKAEFQLRCISARGDTPLLRLNMSAPITMVLDASAVATLLRLKLHALALPDSLRLMVCESVLNDLRQLRRDIGDRAEVVARVEGETRLVRTDVQAIQAMQSQVEAMLQHLCGGAEIVGGRALTRLTLEKRANLLDVLPTATVESIATCARERGMLWTDDGLLADFAYQEFQVESLNTQQVFRLLLRLGGVSEAQFDSVSTDMLKLNYAGVSMRASMLLRVFQESGWDASSQTVAQVLGVMVDGNVSTHSIVQVVWDLLPALFRSAPSRFTAEQTAELILGALRRRSDWEQLRRLLKSGITRVFGVDVLGAQAIARLLQGWGTSEGAIWYPC